MSIIVNINDDDFKAIYNTINSISHAGMCKYSKSVMFHHGISLRLESTANKTTKLVPNTIELIAEADKAGMTVEEYKNEILTNIKNKKISETMRRYDISEEEATARVEAEEANRISSLKTRFLEYKRSKNEDVSVINETEFEEWCIEQGEVVEGLYKKEYSVNQITLPYIQYNFDASKTGSPESGKFALMNIKKLDYLPEPDEIKRLFKVYTNTEEFESNVRYIGSIMGEELKIKVE